jgi:hypothetical protein
MRHFALVLCAVCLASAAQAETVDACKDVLSNGTLKKTDWKSKDYLKMILLERFMKKSSDDVKKDVDFGGNAYDQMFGGYYDESNHEIHQKELRQSLDYSRVENHELDVALASGDPEILSAWSTCMETRKTLKMHFSNIGARVATLEIKWKAGEPAVPALIEGVSAKTTDANGKAANFALPRVCVYKGATLIPGNACSLTVTLPAATTDLLVVVNSKQFSEPATAYLPQRMKWITYTTTVSSTEAGAAQATYSKANGKRGEHLPGKDVCFNSTIFQGGYPVRMDVANVTDDKCDNEGNCNPKSHKLTTNSACWAGGVEAPSGDRSCGCKASAVVTLMHAVWVPSDTPIDPITGLPKDARAMQRGLLKSAAREVTQRR